MLAQAPANKTHKRPPAFTQMVDLLAERTGGKALLCSDDFFAPMENLIKPGRGIFIADKYTDRGKWMDGWESRRKRQAGHDWCILKLGMRGKIHGFDVDTNFFLGNHPPFCSIDAACSSQESPAESEWQTILKKSALKPGSQNFFALSKNQIREWTHIRLNIFPDGGVARLKVYGQVCPDWQRLKSAAQIDLAAIENGGQVLTCNDMFFSSKDNLIMPGRGVNMGDGWETKRKRVPGHDWVILQLGRPGQIQKFEVDTAHFKGNYPDSCSIDGLFTKKILSPAQLKNHKQWKTLLPQKKLQADHQHFFTNEIQAHEAVSHLRLNIYPDGGVSRLRAIGQIL